VQLKVHLKGSAIMIFQFDRKGLMLSVNVLIVVDIMSCSALNGDV
jgi:hypothetical protein